MVELRIILSNVDRMLDKAREKSHFKHEAPLGTVLSVTLSVLVAYFVGSCYFHGRIAQGHSTHDTIYAMIFAGVVSGFYWYLRRLFYRTASYTELRHEVKNTMAFLVPNSMEHLDDDMIWKLDNTLSHYFVADAVRYAFSRKNVAKCAAKYFENVHNEKDNDCIQETLREAQLEKLEVSGKPRPVRVTDKYNIKHTWWMFEVAPSSKFFDEVEQVEPKTMVCQCSTS